MTAVLCIDEEALEVRNFMIEGLIFFFFLVQLQYFGTLWVLTPSPFPSPLPLRSCNPGYSPTLRHQVSTRLGTSYPTKARRTALCYISSKGLRIACVYFLIGDYFWELPGVQVN